jgi:hypothetical protein
MLSQTLQPYEYAGDSPVNGTDPDGDYLTPGGAGGGASTTSTPQPAPSMTSCGAIVRVTGECPAPPNFTTAEPAILGWVKKHGSEIMGDISGQHQLGQLLEEAVTFIGLHRSWRVSVSDENETAVYKVNEWLERSSPDATDGHQSAQARAVIEVFKSAGGKNQRAMVGGEIHLIGQPVRSIRIAQSSGLTLGAATTCRSELSRALVPGLPPEFARATLNGINHADFAAAAPRG